MSDSSCTSIELLIAAYVDNELDPSGCDRVARHLTSCRVCNSRVAAEQSVQRLMAVQRPGLQADRAPEALHQRCRELVMESGRASLAPQATRPTWAARLVPLAVAATLVLIVAGAFLYQITAVSSEVMAAELAADHMKCFALNSMLGTHHSAEVVEGAMASGFGWQAQLPDRSGAQGLELVGSRPCLYGEGRMAHIMYRHNGHPVSLFMLPRNRGTDEVVDALGHEVAIWSVGDRTFVLIAREDRSEVQRLASFVKASLH